MPRQVKKDWKNTRGLYVQYTYEITEKELFLLEKYGWFFDDVYFYFRQLRRPDILKKAPLWMHPKKCIPAEKHKPYFHEKQVTLEVCLT